MPVPPRPSAALLVQAMQYQSAVAAARVRLASVRLTSRMLAYIHENGEPASLLRGFFKNVSIVLTISVIERVGAVLQTIMIARAIGATEYGRYGLLFGAIGLAASVAGMQ